MSLYRWPSFPPESSFLLAFVFLSHRFRFASSVESLPSSCIVSATALTGLGKSVLPVDALKTSYRPLHEADVTNGVAGHDVWIPLLEKFLNASLSPEVSYAKPADLASTSMGGVVIGVFHGAGDIRQKKSGPILNENCFHLSPNAAAERRAYGTEFTSTCCGDGLTTHLPAFFRSRWRHVVATG